MYVYKTIQHNTLQSTRIIIPDSINFVVVDDTICVSDRDAFVMCKKLAMNEVRVGGLVVWILG